MVELDQFEAHEPACRWTATTRGSAPAATATRADCRASDYDPTRVRPHNMWGCSNAQIFSEVSPRMHWEFALQHDLRWLSRWGLTYYGCCEPLDRKIDILRRIPNLRKISVSPWCNTERVVEKIGARLRDQPQAEPGHSGRRRLASRAGPAGASRFPGTSRRRLPRRADHERHLHGPLPAAAALGVGPDRDGSGRAIAQYHHRHQRPVL